MDLRRLARALGDLGSGRREPDSDRVGPANEEPGAVAPAGWSRMREAVAGGGLAGSRKAPAPAGRAQRLGLRELPEGESRAAELGLRVVAAADEHAFSQELVGQRDGAEVLVFDLFLDSFSGPGPGGSAPDLGWSTVRYHCAAVALAHEHPWMAITDRRPPYQLYPGMKGQRINTGDSRADRHHRVFLEAPEAGRWMSAPTARGWLAEALSARIEHSRSGLVLELCGEHALFAVRASDFAAPDEMTLMRAERRGGSGPWPDELLRRLLALRLILVAAGPDS
jgi:hypothetical protein